MFCLFSSTLGHLRSQCSIVCGSSLQRGHRGSVEGFDEIGVGFQQWGVAGSQAHKESASARLPVAVHSLGQEKPPYTATVLRLVAGGSMNVLRMRDLAEA